MLHLAILLGITIVQGAVATGVLVATAPRSAGPKGFRLWGWTGLAGLASALGFSGHPAWVFPCGGIGIAGLLVWSARRT